MPLRRLAVPLAIATALAAAPPAEAGDAGAGGDAPDAWADAWTVPNHAPIEGAVDPGDAADWYRLPAGPGLVLDLEITVSTYSKVQVRDADGRRVGDHWFYGPRTARLLVEATGPFVHVGALSWGYAASYALVPHVVRAPDLAVEAIEVRDAAAASAGGISASANPRREIAITVANLGGANPGGGYVDTRVSHPGDVAPWERRLPNAWGLALDPGERRTVVIPWDSTGEVGDAVLRSLVRTNLDMNPGNDALAVRSFALVGGAGVGVDALNHDAWVAFPLPRAGAWWPGPGARVHVQYGAWNAADRDLSLHAIAGADAGVASAGAFGGYGWAVEPYGPLPYASGWACVAGDEPWIGCDWD